MDTETVWRRGEGRGRRGRPATRSALPTLALAGALATTLLAGSAQSAEESSSNPSSWYAEAVSQGEQGFVVTHYWSKGSKLRAETVFRGHRIVTIVNGERYYVLDSLVGSGVAIQRSPAAMAEDGGRVRPFAFEYAAVLERGGEKVAEQMLNGRVTEVYRATDARGKSTVWVTRDEPRFPVRAEYYSRATKQTAATSYVNWMADLPIPDAFFDPPERTEMEYVDYEEYLRRSRKEPVGPAPVLYSQLLHGSRE